MSYSSSYPVPGAVSGRWQEPRKCCLTILPSAFLPSFSLFRLQPSPPPTCPDTSLLCSSEAWGFLLWAKKQLFHILCVDRILYNPREEEKDYAPGAVTAFVTEGSVEEGDRKLLVPQRFIRGMNGDGVIFLRSRAPEVLLHLAACSDFSHLML